MITAKNDEKEITRDASFYKKINIERKQTGETSNDPMAITPRTAGTKMVSTPAQTIILSKRLRM
jgi:hypothetical protein